MSAGAAGAVAACWYTTACGNVGSSTCSTSLSPCPPFASCKPHCCTHNNINCSDTLQKHDGQMCHNVLPSGKKPQRAQEHKGLND